MMLLSGLNIAGYNRSDGEQPSVVGQRNPVEHKRRRRTWERALNTTAIRNYDEVIMRRARELLEQFEKRAGEEIDLSMWMSHFA